MTLILSYNQANRFSAITSNDTPGIPSAVDTTSDNSLSDTSTPVTDCKILSITNSIGPVAAERKALLKGFFFLPRK